MPSADVIIAGAGIIGGSIAWRLAQQGISVQLADTGRLGGQASWAGAGMLAPGSEVVAPSEWGRLALESWREYGTFVKELEAESAVPIDYRVCGAIELALDDREAVELRNRSHAQAAIGIPSTAASEAEILSQIPSLAVRGFTARHYPKDAQVDPRHVTSALGQACLRRNVTISEQTSVNRIQVAASGVTVHTAGDRWTAATAVIAAGAWSSAIQVEVEGSILPIPESYPIRGHLLGYDLPPGSLAPMLRCGHTYLLQRSNGLVIAGTSEERVGFDPQLDPDTVDSIRRRAERLLPEPLMGQHPGAWIGFRPATASLVPVLESHAGGRLWLAYGHYRNGILMAPATARVVALAINASLRKD